MSVNKIYSFSPIAINPENNQAFAVNSTINFTFVATPAEDRYFLRIYSDNNLQDMVYESSINHDSRYLSELTINVWVNFKAGEYFWRIETNSGSATSKYTEACTFYLVHDVENIIHQYPNPFNQLTNFEYVLNSTSEVTLEIFNTLGQKLTTIISETQPEGFYTQEWNAQNVASGLYIYRFRANNKEQIGKFNIVK